MNLKDINEFLKSLDGILGSIGMIIYSWIRWKKSRSRASGAESSDSLSGFLPDIEKEKNKKHNHKRK